MPGHPIVGKLIREARLRANITLESLAEQIGVSKPYLSLMETGKRPIPDEIALRIEQKMALKPGSLVAPLHWENIPLELRTRLEQTVYDSQSLTEKLRKALKSRSPVRELRKIVEKSTPQNIENPIPLRRQIPVINKVAAGYPAEFTDLDYPVSVADEYISCPDVNDPTAFAARVCGDSMTPDYSEGDLVVFSPQLPTPDGTDCYIRLARDNESTFKRIFLENQGKQIRLQPLNNAYPPQTLAREDITGLYAAAFVMRKIGP